MARAPRPASAETKAPQRGKLAEPHPADARRAAVLADPAGFTASIRFGGRNNTLHAETLHGAAMLAASLEAAAAAHGGSTRATVYALPRDGGGPEVVQRPDWAKALTPEIAADIAARITRNIARKGA